MRNVSLSLVTAPTTEPISVAEAKAHMNVTSSDDDTIIGVYTTAAREYVEAATKRQLMTATWKLGLDCFPDGEILLPLPPTLSVSSIIYVDTAGVSQTLSSSLYQVDVLSEPARIMPAYGQSWPDTRDETYNAVLVQFVAGYHATPSTTTNVPAHMKLAIRLLVDHMYKHRSPTIEGVMSNELAHSLKSLLWMDRAVEIPGLAA